IEKLRILCCLALMSVMPNPLKIDALTINFIITFVGVGGNGEAEPADYPKINLKRPTMA
ncbi:MAG: hypothetical protein JWM44_4265, partial [Bacilli bacterium]|nr:hypothetical protein [Bacilli bacterium]